MKTSEELGLKPEHYRAFIEFAERAERGELRHVLRADVLHDEDIDADAFNMLYWELGRGCGTVMCVGGWVERLSGVRFGNDEVDDGSALAELFYPKKLDDGEWNNVTPQRAAQVVRHYLETGVVDWRVMHG